MDNMEIEEADLNIERVTFYKLSHVPSRSHENAGQKQNLMQISLPRLKFLEDEGPYKPAWSVDYTPPPPPEIVVRAEPTKFRKPYAGHTRGHMLGAPLTEMEQVAMELLKKGLSVREIAHRCGWSMGGAKDAAYRAKVKLGLTVVGKTKKAD